MAKINTVFGFTDNVTNPLKRMQGQVESTTKSISNMAMKMLGVNQAITLINTAVSSFSKATSAMEMLTQTYNVQAEQELKLETIMVRRMNSTKEDIQAIKDLASAQQELGIYGDELILAGAQEIATFVSNKDALELLIPAMNNMIAQHDGLNASTQTFISTADMMGKVMAGQTGALSKNGWIFSEEEEQLLKTGNEMERAATLAKIITETVGDMNMALAQTDTGAITNATNAIGDLYERLGQNLMKLKRAFIEIKSSVLQYFEQPIIKAIDWIKQNIDTLTAMFIYIATAATVAGTTMAVAWAIANWPLTIGVTLLMTIVRMLYAVIDSSNKASIAMNGLGNQCEKTATIFGTVIGGISGAISGLLNIVYNAFITIWNLLAYIAEFVVNIFTHPIEAVARLFIDLGNTLIQILATVAGAIDLLFNTNISSSLHSLAQQLEKFKGENFGNVDYQIYKFALKDVTGIKDASIMGANIGKNIGGILDEKFEILTTPSLNVPLPSSPFIDLKTDSNGALLVSDNSLVDLTSDYKELLSKRATEKFALSFSQITPEVNIGDVTIGSNIELDEFIEKITSGIEQAQASSLSN